HPSPFTLHPSPFTLHPSPFTLHPAPYTLHPSPFTLHPTPCTLHPAPCTLHPAPCTLHPAPCTLHPAPFRTPCGGARMSVRRVTPRWQGVSRKASLAVHCQRENFAEDVKTLLKHCCRCQSDYNVSETHYNVFTSSAKFSRWQCSY
ncbi:hypothetical protein T484DRAFT_3644806, partial [Baffinella frigidus]